MTIASVNYKSISNAVDVQEQDADNSTGDYTAFENALIKDGKGNELVAVVALRLAESLRSSIAVIDDALYIIEGDFADAVDSILSDMCESLDVMEEICLDVLSPATKEASA